MTRFLKDTDYDTLVRNEIRKLLDGRAPDGTGTPVKLISAENMAVRQIRNWLSDRYDCDTIFGASQDPDERDQFIVMVTIDLTLYHLYSQTQHIDIPKHRHDRYADALDWLKVAGSGKIPADLPVPEQEEGEEEVSDFRISSDKQENHIY